MISYRRSLQLSCLGTLPLFLALLASAPPCAVAAPPAKDGPTLGQYQSLLSDYQDAITSGDKVSPEAARNLGDRLAHATSIQRSPINGLGGDNVVVDNSNEITTLRHIAGTPHGAEADKDAQDRVQLLVSLVAPDSDGVAIADPDKAAKDILNREEFRYGDPKKLPEIKSNFLERVMESIARAMKSMGEAFLRFLRWLNGGRDLSGPNVGSLEGLAVFVKFLAFTLLVVGAVGGIVYFAVRWYQNGGRFTMRRRTAVTVADLDLGPDEVADPLGSARRMAEFGDYRGAIRLVYIASLRKLAVAGLLVLEANHTNWEYQNDLRSRSSRVYATMLPATRMFDRVWYGRNPASMGEFERLVAIHDQLPNSPGGLDAGSATTSALSVAEADR